MAQSDQADPNPVQRTRMATLVHNNNRVLQVAGMMAIAGVSGAAGGLLLVKVVSASKGAGIANLALAAKGGAAVKAGTTSLPVVLAPKGAGALSAAAIPTTSTSATTGASIPSVANLLDNIQNKYQRC